MSKSASILLLDCGPAMADQHLPSACNILFQILHSKLIAGRKTDQVGVVYMGTEDTDNDMAQDDYYQHIQVAFDIAMPTLDLLRQVNDQTVSSHSNVDVMEGLIISIDLLIKHCKKLKFEKKIYIMTQLAGELNEEDLDAVKKQIKNNDIQLNLILFESDAPGYEEKKQVMTQLVEDCDGNVFDAEEALDILSDFQTKKVKPTTIFRGPLTLGDEQKHGLNALSMEVFVYSKTMEVKLPSAKKWSALPEARSHRVNMERTYHMAHNPEEEEDEEPGVGPEVLKDDLIRAYRYGKVLVPFTEEDEDAMKIKTMKSMQVLGFIKMDKVKRWWVTSNVLAVIPNPDSDRSQKIFSALFYRALLEQDSVALVRYCRIENASPRLGVFMPKLGKNPYCLWLPIPYANDLHMLDFPRLNAILETPKNKKHKLNTCSVDKKQANDALDEWINSLDCVIEDDDEEEELYTPRRTFNPAYQRLYACIADRAIHPEKADSNEPDLPPVNPEVIQRLSPHPTLLEKSQEAFDKVQSIFTLKKVEKRKKGQDQRKVMESQDLTALEDDIMKSLRGESTPVAVQWTARPTTNHYATTISLDKPILDFRAILERKDQDVVSEAVENMVNVIKELVFDIGNDPSYRKAVECLEVLRTVAVEEDEVGAFNDLLKQLRQEATAFHETWIKPLGMGLITVAENRNGALSDP